MSFDEAGLRAIFREELAAAITALRSQGGGGGRPPSIEAAIEAVGEVSEYLDEPIGEAEQTPGGAYLTRLISLQQGLGRALRVLQELPTADLQAVPAAGSQAALTRPHIVGGEFQSDKYPTCPRGKVPLSVKDTTAQDLLWEYAQRRRLVDAQFSDDLEWALREAGYTSTAQLDRLTSEECKIVDAWRTKFTAVPLVAIIDKLAAQSPAGVVEAARSIATCEHDGTSIDLDAGTDTCGDCGAWRRFDHDDESEHYGPWVFPPWVKKLCAALVGDGEPKKESARRSSLVAWQASLPDAAEVKRRHDVEGQPPRWWWRDTKPDHHGNERYVFELRVLGGVVHYLDRHEGWLPATGLPSSGEWLSCVPEPID